jgi:hypothetical protein
LGPLGIGVALVAVYLLAVTGTLPLGRNVRPLFEGIGPPPVYRWVKPPAAFASGNIPPRPSDTDIPLGPTGSQQTGAQSEDNQLVLNLAPNAAAPHPPDTSVRVHIEPLDPATLGPPPPEFRANGNAYRVTLTYEPSGAPVTSLTAGGNVLLTVPLPPAGLLYSGDGRTWSKLQTQIVPGQPIVGATFSAPGYYQGATHPAAAPKRGGGGISGTIIVAVLVAALALALGLFPLVRRRLRSPRPSKPAAKKATRQRPKRR